MASTKTNTNGLNIAEELRAPRYTNSDVRRSATSFIKHNGAFESFEKFEAKFYNEYPDYEQKIDKWTPILQEARNTALEKTVRSLQDVCLQKIKSLSRYKEFSSKDTSTFESSISDATLNEFNDTVEAKIAHLRKSINVYLPSAEAGIISNSQRFYSMLSDARSAGYIGTKKSREWQNRLESSRWTWYEKQEFINHTFPGFMRKWAAVAKSREEVLKEAANKNVPASDIKELAAISKSNSSYADYSFGKKKNLVNTASAKLIARSKNMPQQYRAVEAALKAAAAEQILSRSKISTWLKRVFTSSRTQKEVEEFLGSGPQSFAVLSGKWREVKQSFNTIERDRKQIKQPTKFNFVSAETFLRWHYTTRTAYVAEAKSRLQAAAEQPNIFAQVEQELDRKDFKSALYILSAIPISTLQSAEVTKLYTMRDYAQTQLDEQHREQAIVEPNTQEADIEAMNIAIEDLGKISQPYKSIIERAIAISDYGAVITIMAAAEKGSTYSKETQDIKTEASHEIEAQADHAKQVQKTINAQVTEQKKNMDALQESKFETQEQPQAVSVSTMNKATHKPIVPEPQTYQLSESKAPILQEQAEGIQLDESIASEPVKIEDATIETKTQRVQAMTESRIQEITKPIPKAETTTVTPAKPTMKVMKLDAAGGGSEAIIAQCQANQTDKSFLQNTMLTIEGIDTPQYKTIANMNRKITAGMRASQQVSNTSDTTLSLSA